MMKRFIVKATMPKALQYSGEIDSCWMALSLGRPGADRSTDAGSKGSLGTEVIVCPQACHGMNERSKERPVSTAIPAGDKPRDPPGRENHSRLIDCEGARQAEVEALPQGGSEIMAGIGWTREMPGDLAEVRSDCGEACGLPPAASCEWAVRRLIRTRVRVCFRPFGQTNRLRVRAGPPRPAAGAWCRGARRAAGRPSRCRLRQSSSRS